MAIPKYQELMLPLLELAGDGQVHSMRQAIDLLADAFQLSDEERRLLLQSGNQTVFANRLGWARTYLKKAGLLRNPKQGYFEITDRGRKVLQQKPTKIDREFLHQFPEFVEFVTPKNSASPEAKQESSEGETPEERMEEAYAALRDEIAAEVLQAVKASSPEFFEFLVVDLLVRMGYGGTRKDAGQAIGASGDGGIDGIIQEDRLGLDVIYLQAKRWENVVGRPEIQKFAGALQGVRAKKGVFLTTSYFSQEAKDYVKNIDSKIILIDGQRLTELMIDFGVGVTTVRTYEVKRLDSDYFVEG